MDLTYEGVDSNGFPVNPTWVDKIPDPFNRCEWKNARAGEKGGRPSIPCTHQLFDFNTIPPTGRTLIAGTNSLVFACRSCKGLEGKVPAGHFNWIPAQFRGSVAFENFSPSFADDKDVNLGMMTSEAGVTAGNKVGSAYPLHLEFYAYESLLTSPWWVAFWKAPESRRRDLLRSVAGTQAVAVGLFGIDCEHECHAELHPVYSLALQVKDDSGSPGDKWVFFARNWGDEGYCGTKQYLLRSPGGDRFVLEIPWKSGAGAVMVTASSVKSNSDAVTVTSVVSVPGKGVYLTFNFPPASAFPRVDGEISLTWSGDATGGDRSPESFARKAGPADTFSLIQERLQSVDNPGIDKATRLELAKGTVSERELRAHPTWRRFAPDSHDVPLPQLTTAANTAVANRPPTPDMSSQR